MVLALVIAFTASALNLGAFGYQSLSSNGANGNTWSRLTGRSGSHGPSVLVRVGQSVVRAVLPRLQERHGGLQYFAAAPAH